MLGQGLDLIKTQNKIVVRPKTGNSLTLRKTLARALPLMEILGETLCKKVVFGTNYFRIDGAVNPFTTGTATINGTSVQANNKSAAIVSVSGQYVYVAAGTFTPATELQGSITDGTNTLNIAVSPSDPQTLTSLTSFDYAVSNADASESVTATISLKDNSDVQLEKPGNTAYL